MAKYLAQNLKTLRKKRQISQEVLAQQLGIKRSNIAAYESKNVEPRLRIILEMARFFDISLKTLIEEKLEVNKAYPTFHRILPVENKRLKIRQIEEENIQQFVEKTVKIRKVLEGFKAFYLIKKEQINNSKESNQLLNHLDGFIDLMEYLMRTNESIIKSLSEFTYQPS